MLTKAIFSFLILSLIIFSKTLHAYDTADTIYNFKLKSIDAHNAEIELDKKRNFFDYTLKYKLKKDIDYNTTSYLNSFNNKSGEDFSDIVFSNHFYFNDSMWMDINMSYKDATEHTESGFDSIYDQQKNTFENSSVMFVYRPKPFLTTNLIFEDYDVDTYENVYSSGYLKKSNDKITLNLKGEFKLLTLNTSIYKSTVDSDYYHDNDYSDNYYEYTTNDYSGIKFGVSRDFDDTFSMSANAFNIVKDYSYLYDGEGDDDSIEKTKQNQKGVELAFTKEFFDNFKIIGNGKITDFDIVDSNKDSLVGNRPEYSPQRIANLSLEYTLTRAKLFSKFTHVSSRYSDAENTNKLDGYTIGSIGAIFNSRIDNRDVRFDINIENIFNEDYYLYSDTMGRPRTLFFNITIEL